MKLSSLVAALLTLTTVSVNGHAAGAITTASHTPTESYHWYCKLNDCNEAPPLPSEFSFITENGGYYLDTKASDDDKVIYLTFDAGYENGNIEKILDTLKAHGATGAFFVLGNLIKRNTSLMTRMVEEGHLVCNHTDRHLNMTKVTDYDAFAAELSSLETQMKEYCGVSLAPFYRPPEGTFSEQNLQYAKKCGYQTIFWSYAYADWDNDKQLAPEKALKKLIDHTHNGEVLLLHPTSATNAAILDEYLCYLEAEGYRFGTLYELTGTA